jgi:sugar-specific transcriptional regulator TrmB
MAQEASFLADAGFSHYDLLVYDAIIKLGPSTRDTLVQKLQMPRTTIYDSLKFLEKLGLVARRPMYPLGPMARGRPWVEFYLVGRDDQ